MKGQQVLQNEILGPSSNHTAEHLRFLPSRQKVDFILPYLAKRDNGVTANEITEGTSLLTCSSVLALSP